MAPGCRAACLPILIVEGIGVFAEVDARHVEVGTDHLVQRVILRAEGVKLRDDPCLEEVLLGAGPAYGGTRDYCGTKETLLKYIAESDVVQSDRDDQSVDRSPTNSTLDLPDLGQQERRRGGGLVRENRVRAEGVRLPKLAVSRLHVAVRRRHRSGSP